VKALAKDLMEREKRKRFKGDPTQRSITDPLNRSRITNRLAAFFLGIYVLVC